MSKKPAWSKRVRAIEAEIKKITKASNTAYRKLYRARCADIARVWGIKVNDIVESEGCTYRVTGFLLGLYDLEEKPRVLAVPPHERPIQRYYHPDHGGLIGKDWVKV